MTSLVIGVTVTNMTMAMVVVTNVLWILMDRQGEYLLCSLWKEVCYLQCILSGTYFADSTGKEVKSLVQADNKSSRMKWHHHQYLDSGFEALCVFLQNNTKLKTKHQHSAVSCDNAPQATT
jgi:type IV secretory pathway TrbF-like protein